MGKAEEAVKKRVRRTRLQKNILTAVAVAGVLPFVLVAPNVLGAMGKMGIINFRQKKQSVNRSLALLIKEGYVAVRGGISKREIVLTTKGEKFAAFLGEGRLALKKPKRWDGKWRLVLFDIPERRKKLRAQLRITLSSLGFVRLQNSAWVYPYDCEDLIALFKTDSQLGKDVCYLIADYLEDDQALRFAFDLPS